MDGIEVRKYILKCPLSKLLGVPPQKRKKKSKLLGESSL